MFLLCNSFSFPNGIGVTRWDPGRGREKWGLLWRSFLDRIDRSAISQALSLENGTRHLADFRVITRPFARLGVEWSARGV